MASVHSIFLDGLCTPLCLPDRGRAGEGALPPHGCGPYVNFRAPKRRKHLAARREVVRRCR